MGSLHGLPLVAADSYDTVIFCVYSYIKHFLVNH